MPWTQAQHRLVEWVAHDPKAAHAAGYKIPVSAAKKMASEGVKPSKEHLVKALKNH
jgi:hypothetical protein